MMNQDCYPFTFVHRSRNCGQGILYVDIYRFKSTKSNLVYLIRVERYEHNMYAVKFYQKNHRLSPKKYQILSNTFEARRIIYTCMNIMFCFTRKTLVLRSDSLEQIVRMKVKKTPSDIGFTIKLQQHKSAKIFSSMWKTQEKVPICLSIEMN